MLETALFCELVRSLVVHEVAGSVDLFPVWPHVPPSRTVLSIGDAGRSFCAFEHPHPILEGQRSLDYGSQDPGHVVDGHAGGRPPRGVAASR